MFNFCFLINKNDNVSRHFKITLTTLTFEDAISLNNNAEKQFRITENNLFVLQFNYIRKYLVNFGELYNTTQRTKYRELCIIYYESVTREQTQKTHLTKQQLQGGKNIQANGAHESRRGAMRGDANKKGRDLPQ